MQYLFLLVLVGMYQAQVDDKVYEEPELPRPNLLGLTALDPPGLQVEWDMWDNVPGLEPIKGYKILVWELRPVKVSDYDKVDGVYSSVEGFRPPKVSDSGTRPEEDAMKIIVSSPLISKAQVPNIKFNSVYEVRVRVFTESEDGPLSSHMSIQLLDQKHTNMTNDETTASIPTLVSSKI